MSGSNVSYMYNDDHFENFQNLCYNGFPQEALEYVISEVL